MIKSMTGFGRFSKRKGNISVTVEIKSVNHRFIDIGVRMPKFLNFYESNIKKAIKKNFNRGYFETFIYIEDEDLKKSSLSINHDLAKQYIKSVKELKKKYKLSGDIDINFISSIKDIFTIEEKKNDTEKFCPLIDDALNNALKKLLAMRISEGKSLTKDIMSRIKTIEEHTVSIEKKRKKVILSLKEKLDNRIKEFILNHTVDEKRLFDEAIIASERTDIAEEVTRLKNHLIQFKKITKEKEPVGRKLDFLLQEMNREINTLSSKANDFNISNHAVCVKSELEKIKEQVQNIE